MAVVKPFCGIRYNPKLFKDLSLITAPPYDQIQKNLQEELHFRHQCNVVRLILGLEQAGDSEKRNKYTRAKQAFDGWFSGSILVRDTTPSLYIYEQQFTFQEKSYSRSGFVSLVQVEPFEKRVILPHEKILTKPFLDRKKLLLETGVHFESIFLLYPDKDGHTVDAKQMVMQNSPIMEVKDDNGVVHRVWPLSDPVVIEKLAQFWEPLQFFIADGHHRYNTAIECSKYSLATLFCMEDPNLVILPTHRLIRKSDNFNMQLFIEKVNRYFDIKEPGSIDELLNALSMVNKYKRCGYGMILKDHLCLLVLREDVDLNKFTPDGVSRKWMKLDVSVLHQLLLGDIIADLIEYIRVPEDAVKKVQDGDAEIAFLLNPTSIEDVRDFSLAGETMPQKSTDFYPKLLSGLIMSSANID